MSLTSSDTHDLPTTVFTEFVSMVTETPVYFFFPLSVLKLFCACAHRVYILLYASYTSTTFNLLKINILLNKKKKNLFFLTSRALTMKLFCFFFFYKVTSFLN